MAIGSWQLANGRKERERREEEMEREREERTHAISSERGVRRVRDWGGVPFVRMTNDVAAKRSRQYSQSHRANHTSQLQKPLSQEKTKPPEKKIEKNNSLLLNTARLPHLRTKTAVQAEAKYPGPLPIVNLPIAGTSLRSVCACHRSATVQIQICCHPASERAAISDLCTQS